MSSGRAIASLGAASSPIRVTLSDLEGTHVVDIRKYYLDKISSELKPTQKGIAVREENFAELMAVLSENESAILDWLRGSAISKDVEGRATSRRTLLSQPIRVVYRDDESLRGPHFFECSHKGSAIEVAFGSSHALAVERRALGEAEAAASQLLALVLASFDLAVHMTSGQTKVESDLVSCAALKMNWGVALKHVLKSLKA